APSWASVDAKHRVVDKQPRRPNFGGEVNSDVGVAGQIAIDEANFDVEPGRSVEERLSQQVTVQFSNLPLNEALAVISRQIDLPIEIDLEDAAAEGVTPEQPVTLAIEETSADNALWLLLETHDLRYSLEDNKVVVRGISSAPMITVVYSIVDLLMHDLAWLDQPEVAALPHRSAESRAAATLVASIVDRVQPESWDKMGGRGAIKSFLINQSLVILQTEPVHRKVGTFLAETRKQLGVISEMPQSPPFHLLQSKKLQQNVNMHTKVYAVADLVIPAPPVRPVLRGPYNLLHYGTLRDLLRYGTLPQGLLAADFDTLVDLITSTVVPESWASAGGSGQIEVFPTNLSMVINQSADVHEQVADLIEQLRRMQGVQVSIETQLLRVPKSFLPTDKLPGFVVRDVAELDARGVENVGGPTRLSATEAAALLQAIDQAAEDADCRNVALPKITLFNGQQVQLSAQENGLFKSTLEYQAAICSDRSIFLKVATDAKLSLDEQFAGEMLASGSSLLVRVDDSPAGTWKSDATTNSPASTEYVHLLLVTPTVIVVGE
ncbi:MAG TPA: hypothetical protein VMM76_00250, partial [Pirellulaceae bacterium]|nr:hypothetical protein [Pirellulaceae bacterium]